MRPWRQLRRWWLHTPSNQAAIAMIGIGFLLIVAAAVGYYVAHKYG